MIGQTVLHYQILEKLGEGGMGVVYKAHDSKLKRDVAVKFLPRHISSNEEERARFKIEAQAAAALNHPNIAHVHAIEEHGDEMFIVMECIEGKELRDFIIHSLQFEIHNCLELATQIAAGLQTAHKKGIVHRDIKSSNIMITAEEQVKIMDFGLAKVHGGTLVTKVGTTLGTVAYMSPEQARGEEVDHRTDIWSFGVVLYEMLCGHPPFQGDYELSMLYSILNEDPKPVQTERADVPDDLDKLVQHALTKDREKRYQEFDAVLSDLNALQHNQVSPSPPRRKAARWALFPHGWRLTTIVLLVLSVAALFFLFRSKQQESGSLVSIVVMPFEFEGSEENWNWLGAAVTDLIGTELAKYPQVRVVGAQQKVRIMFSLGIHGKNIGIAQASQVARKAKAKNILLGNLEKKGQTIRVQARIYQAGDGSLLAQLRPVEGPPANLYEIAGDLSLQLFNTFHIGSTTDRPAGSAAQRTIASLDAFRYFVEGKDAALDNRYQEAIPKLKKALTLDSTYVRAYYYLAWQYSQIGDDRKARATLVAGKPYVSGLSLPDRLEYLCEEAKYDDRWRDYATHLEQLLRIDPFDATVHFRYGWTQFHKFRRLDEGIRAMEKSLELDSTNGWAVNSLGYAYLSRGDVQKALAMIEKYIALNPTDVNPLDSKAEIQMLVGQYDEALRNCERILTTQPDFLSARIILARTYVAQGRYSQALATVREYMPIAGNSRFKAKGHAVESEVLIRRGEFHKALDSAELAIAADSTNLRAHWSKGRILLQLNQQPALDAELATQRRQLQAQGGLDGRWFLHHLQGEIALQSQNFDQAIESFERALSLGPLDRSFYLAALAQAYKRAGRTQPAVKKYQEALSFNPNNAWAVLGLARVYEQQGKATAAARAYRRVLALWSRADRDLPELQYAQAQRARIVGKPVR
ncbi:MAG: protein kinase [bacterium]